MTRFKGNPWAALVVLCMGFFMILLDTTIVNIAIPSMMAHLHATIDQILWVLNAYILVYAVLLITAGRLGDMFGQRRVFVVGLVLFTVASAGCGLAQDPTQLIVARVIQGVGGALLTPQTLAILTTIFPPQQRGAAFGVWGGIAGIAAVAGPTLGGYIVTDFGWRWIFYVNLPIGVLAVSATYLFVPDIRAGRGHRLDIVGVALSTIGLLAVTYGLIDGQRYDWGTISGFLSIPLVLGLGAAFLVAFLLQQRFSSDEPLLPFSLMRQRNFSLMNVVGLAMAFGMFGLFLPITLYLQNVLGLSALQAGLTVAPMSLVSMVIAPFAGRMSDRFGGKFILMGGLTGFAAGMGIIVALAEPASSRWEFLPGYVLAGVGMGCIFAPIATVAMQGVEPRLAGAASGLLNTTRQLGGVIGSAAVGAVLQHDLATQLLATARRSAGALPAGLPASAKQHIVAGFGAATHGGLEASAQTTHVGAPPGTPAAVVAAVQRWTADVFGRAFVSAMKPSLVLPIVVLLIAAASCAAVVRLRAADLPIGFPGQRGPSAEPVVAE